MDAKERKALGLRIREERKARRWSQPELAERAEVSTGTVSATERGLSTPQPANLNRLLDELGISMNGDDTSDAPEPTGDAWYTNWFREMPADSRSVLYMIGLYLERLGPDERDLRIRQITRSIIEQEL